MRPIKFRFWSPPGKSFVEQYKYSGYVNELFDQDDMLIPCQYTGLQDKNGKDVYENDLIGVFLDKNGFGVVKVGKITFKHGAFCVEYLEPTSTMKFNFMHQVGPFEVIGCALEKNEH
jgi:uncharacterized phage protein (TIGR01671 family)